MSNERLPENVDEMRQRRDAFLRRVASQTLTEQDAIFIRRRDLADVTPAMLAAMRRFVAVHEFGKARPPEKPEQPERPQG